MSVLSRLAVHTVLAAATLMVGCDRSWQSPLPGPRVNLSPSTQPVAGEVSLDSSLIAPVHKELLAIDLPTVVEMVQARNTDILSSRLRVEAVYGRYATSIGNALPAVAPGVLFEFHQGGARDSSGKIITANFTSLRPDVAIQWIVSPGQVAYDILASKKRLEASQQDELSVRMRALQQAVIGYYDLCLAQAATAAALEARNSAEELVRITGSKLRMGTAVPADDWRARAALAGRQQDLLVAINEFYHASIALATTLDMDASVTLVPKPDKLSSTTLVSEELSLDQLVATAIEYRPDLQSARKRLAAAHADTRATTWGGLGPIGIGGYEAGGISSHAAGQNFGMRGDQGAPAGVAWELSAGTVGQIQTVEALYKLADVQITAQLDALRAEVVRSKQDSRTTSQIISIATEHVKAAQESLSRIEASYRVGKAILLDVLDAQASLAQARLRYALAVIGYNQSQVRILAALGVLDASALGCNRPTTQPATQASTAPAQ